MAEVIVHSADAIIGRAFRDQLTDIGELTEKSSPVTIQGTVGRIELRELRDEVALLCSIFVKDKTGSVPCKCFLSCRHHNNGREEIGSITEEDKAAVMNKVNRIAIGMTVIVRGECTYDIDTGEPNILVRDLAGVEKKTP